MPEPRQQDSPWHPGLYLKVNHRAAAVPVQHLLFLKEKQTCGWNASQQAVFKGWTLDIYLFIVCSFFPFVAAAAILFSFLSGVFSLPVIFLLSLPHGFCSLSVCFCFPSPLLKLTDFYPHFSMHPHTCRCVWKHTCTQIHLSILSRCLHIRMWYGQSYVGQFPA